MKKNKKKEQIDIELTEQKAGFEMMKMLLTLDEKVYKKKTRKYIVLADFIESLQKQADEEYFQKSNWMIV